MKLQEFIQVVNTFFTSGYEIIIAPHSDIDSEYNLFIHIGQQNLYFSFDIKNHKLYIEDEQGVVFIKECEPTKAVKIIHSFAASL